MDTPTQALLGATIGQACFGHKLGGRAALWGGIAAIIPDLDLVVVPFMGRMGEQLYHRGPTHAFWFGPIFGVLMGYALWRWYAARPPRRMREDLPHPGAEGMLRVWVALSILALFTHPILDLFTVYGTQFLWPFSDARLAWNAIAIIDPVYSLLLLAALIAGWILRRRIPLMRAVAVIALVLSSGYILFGLSLNAQARNLAAEQLADDSFQSARLEAYPTLFQIFLRRVVARNAAELRVGYVSLWQPEPIAWHSYRLPDDPRIDQLAATQEGRVFNWFAMNQIAAQVAQGDGETVVTIEDVRYGFPGPAEHGMWGIRGRFNPDGEVIGTIEYFDRRPDAPVGELLAELWRDTFFPRAPKG
jgi:inner membrane protein